MSKPSNTVYSLLSALAVTAAVLVAVAVTRKADKDEPADAPPPSPVVRLLTACGPIRTDLVDPKVLSWTQVDEVTPGHGVPSISVTDYLDGERITCHHCGGSYTCNANNTTLHTFDGYPADTYAMHVCPGPECGPTPDSPGYYFTVTRDADDLARYFADGYQLTLDAYDPSRIANIRQLIGAAPVTEIQTEIYTAIMALETARKASGQAVTDE